MQNTLRAGLGLAAERRDHARLPRGSLRGLADVEAILPDDESILHAAEYASGGNVTDEQKSELLRTMGVYRFWRLNAQRSDALRPDVLTCDGFGLIDPRIAFPSHIGFAPFAQLAYLIVSRGGQDAIDVEDKAKWQSAYAELLGRSIAKEEDGKLHVEGVKFDDPSGKQQRVPDEDLKGLHGLGPCAPVVSGERTLTFLGPVDADHWRNGFDEKIFDAAGRLEWRRLVGNIDDFRRLWPSFWPFDPPARHSSIASETKCTDWLKETMAASPDKRTRSKNELMQLAQKKFEGLSGHAFGRAWGGGDQKLSELEECWRAKGQAPGENPPIRIMTPV